MTGRWAQMKKITLVLLLLLTPANIRAVECLDCCDTCRRIVDVEILCWADVDSIPPGYGPTMCDPSTGDGCEGSCWEFVYWSDGSVRMYRIGSIQ